MTQTDVASSQTFDARTSSRARRWLIPAVAAGMVFLAITIVLAPRIELPGLLEEATFDAPVARNRVVDAFAALGELPPAAFFGAMAVLCILPIPVSAFYVTGAAMYGPGTALAWISGALVINIWLGQTLASRGLRPLATRVLAARGIQIPIARNRREERWLVVLVRIAPGLPFFAQNLALGLAGVDTMRSMAISLPIQLAFACTFVWLGQSAFEGRLGTAIAAIGLIASASIAARLVHRRLAARFAA